MFLSDTIANIKLTAPQKARNKSIQCDDFHCPDLLILQPNKKYKGLFIELKIKSPYLKNGELSSIEHIQNQAKTMLRLRDLGYYACFSWEFEQCKKIIDNYMNNSL